VTTNPYRLTPAQAAAVRRGGELLARQEATCRRHPPPEPPAPAAPRRRRVVLHGLTPEQRQAEAARLLAPPPPVSQETRPRRSVTLADLRRQRPDLADSLTASGYQVRSVAAHCPRCGVRHRLDYACQQPSNGDSSRSYSAVVASGGRLS